MSHSLKGATTATSCNENRNDDEETNSLSLSSPNIIVISGAGKPIYSRQSYTGDPHEPLFQQKLVPYSHNRTYLYLAHVSYHNLI